jgi:hypothetical protein
VIRSRPAGGLPPWAPVLLAFLLIAGAGAAEESRGDAADEGTAAANVGQALRDGSLSIGLRYRFEFVDSASFEKDAEASTLRGVLSYETGSFRGLFAGVTFETVTAIGNDALYNNLGAGDLSNGVTDRPVVADPEIIEVDQLFLGYQGAHGLELRAGRFGYTLDNQRFIGTAGWRQNRRSFEAATVAVGAPKTLRASYAYLGRVYYNNGANPELDGHLVHLAREFGPGTAAAYAYLLDWAGGDRSALSSATYGARFQGSTPARSLELLYLAEYARQVDYGDNPEDFGLDYVHLGFGIGRGAWTLQAGWELKDGDGTSAVQTPLGTNHGKNGFADRLVVTPPEGSQDRYIRVRMDRSRWSWLIAYHDFRAARGGDGLGTEVDFQARYSPIESLPLYLKIARYEADTLLTDVTKVMVWTSWSFDILSAGRP